VNTPVTLIIFNRPDHTEKVFAEIAKARPSKLFVIADGPRPDHPVDVERCAAARGIIDRVDWDCEVFKNYSDINLGCGVRPATGISWVFEKVDKSIILEDDIFPHSTFFRFCEELLGRYQDDERVMMIAGMKTRLGEKGMLFSQYSYGFSRAINQVGWATWRRAWQHYDFEINMWPKLRDSSWILGITGNPISVEFYKKLFDQTANSKGVLDYWDYQWLFTCWAQNGLCIVPNTNLTINIGFDERATHSKVSPQGMPSSLEEMHFPLSHPPYVLRDFDCDMQRYELRHRKKTMWRKWNGYCRQIVFGIKRYWLASL